MSLINDALKKAQKQRTGEAPSLGSMPSVGGESAHRIAGRRKSGGNAALLYGGGAALLLVLAVSGYFAFGGKPEDRGGLASPPAASPNVGSPLVGVPSPSSSPTTPAFTLPTAPKEEPVVAKAALQNEPAPSSASNPQVSGFRSQVSVPSPAPAVQVPAAPPPKLEPRAIQYIENIKIGAVRTSATDSKVLMNDRVYRVGGLVEAEMGIKLVEITATSLTFEDERGGRYTRTL
jgi:hypothetical protein